MRFKLTAVFDIILAKSDLLTKIQCADDQQLKDICNFICQELLIKEIQNERKES